MQIQIRMYPYQPPQSFKLMQSTAPATYEWTPISYLSTATPTYNTTALQEPATSQQVASRMNFTRIMASPIAATAAVLPYPPQNVVKQAILFVGQLNYDVTEDFILNLFSTFGRVLNVVIFKDANKKGLKNVNKNVSLSNASLNLVPPTIGVKRVIGSSAFVTYGSTAEADLAILSLHEKVFMDKRGKPLQVSYCQKTKIISEFGYWHAQMLHDKNKVNPMPSVTPVSCDEHQLNLDTTNLL